MMQQLALHALTLDTTQCNARTDLDSIIDLRPHAWSQNLSENVIFLLTITAMQSSARSSVNVVKTLQWFACKYIHQQNLSLT